MLTTEYSMRRCFSVLRGTLVLAALLASTALRAQAGPYVWTGVEQIVAVGDIHGAYSELVDVLRNAGIIDENLSWSGGASHLVSVGDLIDRGPDSRAVMDLLMRLAEEAPADGGQVHVLMGNHELMNLMGDLRYVAPDDYADYDDDDARATRERAFAAFAGSDTSGADEPTLRQRFDERYPVGYFGHLAAFSASGRYGQWLLGLPALIVINGTVFVHGGLSPALAGRTPAEINASIDKQVSDFLEERSKLVGMSLLPEFDMDDDYVLAREALARFTNDGDDATNSAPQAPPPAAAREPLERFVALHDSPELGVRGPLWYRGPFYCKPVLERSIFQSELASLSASRVVVGHTPTSDRRVEALFDGRLIMLDTGMLRRFYHGHPAALVLEQSQTGVRYAGETTEEPLLPGRREVGYGLTREEALEALGSGSVSVSPDASLEGRTAVTLRVGERDINAVFLPEDRDGTAQHELAAFALDELLGFELVPPTVARSVADKAGALQLVYPDAISEADRLEQKRGFGGWCDIQAEIQLMYAFDLLIMNAGRDASNILFSNDVSDIVLTDYARAFDTSTRLPASLGDDSVRLEPAVAAALGNLDRDALAAAVGDWLSTREQRALLSRRDELLERFAPD